MEFGSLGKVLIAVGVGIALMGVLLFVIGNVAGIGRLPGDIVFRRGPVTFFFPIVTMILLSLVLTVVVSLLSRLFR
ncbi:MAG: DUF2905 domain-containing protein [SAR202 cluster bacterium]|nr:DUF2905 domain-containing protein [SAR202 cluster bacterium]